MHVPLSQSLARLVEGHTPPAGLTLNRLIERTDGRGLFLVLIILCMPFIIPVSIPGVSTVIGGIIFLLAIRLAVGKRPRLPRILGERALPAGAQQKLVAGSVKFLRLIEKVVRPRRTQWLTWRSARFCNSLLMAFMALLLALPIPPIIPFTNSLPSYAIILISVSMMEEDGVTIWLGYSLALTSVIYFAVMAEVISRQLGHWMRVLMDLLQYTQ